MFAGKDPNAEISITSSQSILGVQNMDIDVEFADLTLSHPKGEWVNDLGHTTNYFACLLRNTDAAENTVTYTNCTFPNGVCNNQYGKTVFDNCKFTNNVTGKYNLWNYGGNTEIKGSTFTGTRGIKAYSEGADGGQIEVVDTTFNGLNEKAAIVVSKATTVTLNKVNATECAKGLLQKDIEGGSLKTTIEANGTGISGEFNITATTTEAAAKEEFNITAGTFSTKVDAKYLAAGVKQDASGNIVENYVAKIGTVKYGTLDDAIKAVENGGTIVVNAGEYKLNGSLTYTGKAFTIKAADGMGVSFDMSAAVALHGAKITFEGVTFDYKTNGNYIGLQHTDTLVYNNCTIKGMVFLYATNETFNSCTFTQTSADAYNVWTYGAKNVVFNNCTFKCVGKSVLVYNEGTNTKTDLTVKDTEFIASAPVEGKAAIEIDTSLMKDGTTIKVTNTTAKGFADGSNSKSTLWNDKKQTEKTNKNTTVTVNGEEVFAPKIAEVGGVVYPSLEAAFAKLNAENHTLKLLNESVWAEATPVYWKAGTQSGYAAKLTDALTAAYMANEDNITIVCRPGADVGEMTHGHVADNITIYGNNAYISGGECDLEVDTYMFSRDTGKQVESGGVYLDKNITINAYELDNLGVWGERHTTYEVNVNLTGCDGKAIAGKENVQRVYISGTTGVNNITLTGCNFLTANTAVYSNANGTIIVDGCSFTGGAAPVNINHKGGGAVTVEVKGSKFTNCGDEGSWASFAAPVRFVNSGSGTMDTTVDSCTFTGTVGNNGDILIGDGRTGEKSNNLGLTVKKTNAFVQAQKPGYYDKDGVADDYNKCAEKPVGASEELAISIKSAFLSENAGSEKTPYTLEQFNEMTRAEYIAAQDRLGGTMFVEVGGYEYATNGVLGHGVRNDTPGQKPDHSKLNAYNENGYLGDKNDGANGKSIVFVGGSITSGVKGYESIDSIGTSLLLAVPAYTNVTFKGTSFKNVMSFDYQLYTSPWSQLGSLNFEDCTFNGIIVGAIAAQTLKFDGCTFRNYINSISPNSSNPTWIRPAYGNWTKGDNEGQGTDFRSLTTIIFNNNTVYSTRPVKFERIAQWEMDTTVTATGNTFTINPRSTDGSDTKNVGMYFGANAKFDLIVDNNKESSRTAGLYTAVYSAPNSKSYAGLPAGSTVKNNAGEETSVDALEWKTTKPLTLKTTEEVAQLTTTKGVVVKFATLQEAINAAANGDTVALLLNETVTTAISVTGKSITLDLNGKTLSSKNGITVAAGADLTVKDSSENKTGEVVATGINSNGIENVGTLTIESGSFEAVYGAVRALGGSTTTINGGTFSSSTGRLGMYYWANGKNVSVTVNGGTFKNSVSTAMENGKVTLKVNGGSFSNDLTEYCPAEYGTYLKDSGYYEYALESANVPEGYVVDEDGNVTISTEAGLFWFAHQTNAKGKNFAGKTVTLANDIALTKAWTPIGIYNDSKTHFKGTFDGQNHTVSGVEVLKYSANGVGFFGKVYTGTIKNLTVEGKITAYGCNYVGGIVGHGYATISNCTFKGNVGSTNTMQVGGIAGSGGFTITNCSVYGNVTAECWAGGIVGNCQDGGAYTNCYVEGVISAERTYWGGGAAGITPVPLYPQQVISKCYSNTVVKVAGKEVNCPIIAAYNNPLDYNGYTGDLKIYDNSWNKQKNSNDSYPIYAEKNGVGGVLEEGKDVSRDNNLVMLEDDLQYVTDLSKVRIMPCSAVTQEQVDALAVASIGTAKYITLAAAIAAAKDGETVTLLKDVTENVEIAKEKNLTLDLNGKTLSGGTGTAKAALTNYGTITIKDSSTAKTGTIKRGDNGTVGEISYYVIRNQGTMTIESGTVSNNSGYRKTNPTGSMIGSSLICNGDCDEGGTLTIKGGTFTQNNFIAIKNGALGVLHVTGGTITSNHSAIQNWFKADITGGEIKGQLWTDAWKEGESVGETKIGGDAKFTGEIVMDITGSVAPTLAINGGNLNVTKWRITSVAAKAGAKPAISGGTFNAPVKPEYCAPNHEPVDNGDGTYGVKLFYVAKIDGKEYKTLQEAFGAVSATGTIELLHDVTVTETLTFNKQYSESPTFLKMNGYTITGDGCRALQIVNGHLQIEGNGTPEEGKNVITSTGIGIASSVIRVGAGDGRQNLSIASGVTVKTDCSYGITVFGDGTEFLRVENSKVISTAKHNADYDGCAIATLGTDTTSANVTIKNGAYIEAEDSNAIYMPSGKLLVDNDATVKGLTGIYAKSGNVQIKGAKIYGTGAAKGYNYHGNGGIPTGDALVLDSCGYPNGAPTVDYTGAENAYFESAKAKPIGSYATEGNTKVTGFVDKGTFNKAIDSELLAKDYVCVYKEEGKYGVAKTENCVAKVGDIYYTALQDAIDAANSGDTVELVKKDVDLTKTVVVNKTITLDMGGKKLFNTADLWDNPNKEAANWSLISVRKGGDLTITGNGTFAAKENDCYAVDVQDGAKLVIKDGTFVGNIHAVYVFEGTATIDGGTYSVQQKFSAEKPDEFVLNCYDANRANGTAKIIVNGGTFQNFDPMNNQAEGVGTSFVAAGVGVDHVDGKFTAKSGMTAQVVDADGKSVKAFDKLSDALAAVEAKQTVKLLNDVANETFVMVKAGVTLDLAGKNITGATMLYVTGMIVDTAASNTKGAVSAEAYMIASSVGSGYTPIYSGTGYQFYNLGMNIMTKDVSADGATVIFAPKTENEWTAELNAFRTLLAPGFDKSKVQIVLEVEWGETNTHDSQRFAFNDQYVNKYATEDGWAFSVTMNGLKALSGKVTATAKIITYGADGREMTWLSSDAVPLKGE